MPGAPGLTPVSPPQGGLLDSLREADAYQQLTALADRIAAPPLARVGLTVDSRQGPPAVTASEWPCGPDLEA